MRPQCTQTLWMNSLHATNIHCHSRAVSQRTRLALNQLLLQMIIGTINHHFIYMYKYSAHFPVLQLQALIMLGHQREEILSLKRNK